MNMSVNTNQPAAAQPLRILLSEQALQQYGTQIGEALGGAFVPVVVPYCCKACSDSRMRKGCAAAGWFVFTLMFIPGKHPNRALPLSIWRIPFA